jgi:hypothetical protein
VVAQAGLVKVAYLDGGEDTIKNFVATTYGYAPSKPSVF